MRSRLAWWLLVLLLVAWLPWSQGCRGAQETAPPQGTLYVVNEDDNTVSVIDAAANRVTASIPVGRVPHHIALAPDGARAYVTNGESNSITVIDTASSSVVSTIEGIRRDPQQIAVHPAGRLAYVPCYDTDSLLVVDIVEGRIAASIPTGQSPQSVAISADGSRVYLICLHAPEAIVIDTASSRKVAAFTVGEGACGIAVSPDGQRLYLGGHGTGMWMGKGERNRDVRVISATTFQQLSLVRCGIMPIAVRLSRDGSRAYAVSHGSSDLHIIDTASGKATGIRVGSDCRDVAVSRDGKWAYVSNRSDSTVSVVDVSAKKAVATIHVGSSPVGIALKESTPN